MPIGLLLLAALVALALYVDREATDHDKMKDIDPTSNRLTR
jgi:hypothetical protein